MGSPKIGDHGILGAYVYGFISVMSHFTVILFSFWHFVKLVVCSFARKINKKYEKIPRETKRERKRKRSLDSFLNHLLLLFVCFLVYWGGWWWLPIPPKKLFPFLDFFSSYFIHGYPKIGALAWLYSISFYGGGGGGGSDRVVGFSYQIRTTHSSNDKHLFACPPNVK